MSFLKPFSILCGVCWVMLGVFQLGAQYGSSPYRALVNANGPKLAFTQLGMNQTHTLFVVAGFSAGFALLYFLTLVLRYRRERKERTSLRPRNTPNTPWAGSLFR